VKLLTNEILKKLPQLYATEKVPIEEKVAVAKFFTPDLSWTWYAVEFDGKDTFFGWVHGLEKEWGYFSLSELLSVRGKLGLPVERDKWFNPTKIKVITN